MSQFAPVRFLDRTTPPHIGTLILLSGMSAMVMNMFLPSLPGMTAYFDTEYWVMQMSVSIYLAASAVLQVFIGPLSDKFGRRPVILLGTIGFLLATLGCIYAPTAGVFLICRTLQAMMAVGMVLSRATVRDLYSQDQAASMIGYVTMGMAVVPMISPAIGGFLDQAYDWRASFWFLFVLGALTFVLVWADQGETVSSSGLTLGQQYREYPELLSARRFWGYCAAAAFTSGAFFAYLGGAPFVGTQVYGLSSAELGVYFGAPAIGYFLGNYLTGRFTIRFGVNRMIMWGCIGNIVGITASLVVSYAGYGSVFTFFFFMTFVGLGNGLAIPNATAGMLSVRPRLAGTASGLGGAIMLAGGAMLGQLTGLLLTPETGAFPLLWLQFLTGVLAIVAITLTIRREKQVSGHG
ncbi:Bcr/CflA family efflux MFS transporter [Aliishimia ponticola]|uniref:Bcr/CflA family efflux transporter n=1 Tax=Aliishimia ponticola TaxID=2499833 RepID=A0A4S4NBG9_9RHOB|nr:multidrug effflux MFS transporter [Aliishimia ponticola]THH35807.1 Bcr/CflA family efflux MFS transporter [Aliishimia ponticola]